MNQSFLNLRKVSVLFVLTLLFISCDKDEQVIPTTSEITQEDVMISLSVEEISTFVDDMTLNNIATNKSSLFTASTKNSCQSFTANNTGYTISFNNCDFNNSTVSGSMTVSLSFENSVYTSTVTFDNLTYGGNQINGTKTTTYTLDAAGGAFTFSVTSDLSVGFEDGTTASESGTKNYSVSSLGTAQAAYNITGNWNVTINNDSYSLVANPALTGTFNCGYITSGILTITENGSSASVDYGDGTCDNQATVSLPNGSTVEIDL